MQTQELVIPNRPTDATRGTLAEPPHVLVIDDDRGMRDRVAEFLRDEGFRVTTAPDVFSALRVLLAERPQLVIVDWRMPALDGFQMLRNVEALVPDLPVIFLSAHVRPEVTMAALLRNASAFLPQPLALAPLRTGVRDAPQGLASCPGDAAPFRAPVARASQSFLTPRAYAR